MPPQRAMLIAPQKGSDWNRNWHNAIEGEIFGVTKSLGLAFNSTLIALLISIFLMFLVHQLQLHQERYVLDTEAYCEENLIRHLETQ